MGEAVGIIEVFGLATAFAAADAGCKAANVTIENFDKNKPANADVRAAVAAAKQRAEELAGVVATHEIASPEEDTEKMLRLSGMDKV